MRVEDRMTKDPVTVRADQTVKAAAELMRTHSIRHLPVVDTQDNLVGLLTDRDIRQVRFAPAMRTRLAEEPSLLDQLRVGEVMSSPVVTTAPLDDLADAATTMYERKIGALPVVLQGHVVGIISEVDILKAFAEMTGREPQAAPDDW